MAKILQLNADDEEMLCSVSKALSSPDRIRILKLLYYNSYNILHIPDIFLKSMDYFPDIPVPEELWLPGKMD